ncbi:hypothetical protein QZM64_19665 [Burkholderia cepacia]|uniref:hypothetical protein n=1 Tax=Burkholderia cepacia TaxID=292 RepID=UPI000A97702E|nr:hypothetical protein [Burkholderia cepacia]MDN7441383.1 hypothetical protein [Burkholderia cepacia]
MSAPRKPEFSSSFLESYMYELMSMSDDEVLEGQDVNAVNERADARIAAASREAGRKRLADAKALRQKQDDSGVAQSAASLDEIKAYLREAANDGDVTLAARQLSEMSEADARRLYAQLKQLREGQGDEK